MYELNAVLAFRKSGILFLIILSLYIETLNICPAFADSLKRLRNSDRLKPIENPPSRTYALQRDKSSGCLQKQVTKLS